MQPPLARRRISDNVDGSSAFLGIVALIFVATIQAMRFSWLKRQSLHVCHSLKNNKPAPGTMSGGRTL
jgi:hypothetical protein